LFNGKSISETIGAIRSVQSKPVTKQRRAALSTANSGNSNPMSINAIVQRTGVPEDTVREMLSSKNRGSSNGFYGRRHRPETLAKLAKSRAAQCKQVTKPEMAIWGMLSALKIEFEYQAAVDRYVVDFLLSGKVVIEVYGDYWHNKKMESSGGRNNDKIKVNKLENLGYAVLLIWESDIFLNTSTVVQRLNDL